MHDIGLHAACATTRGEVGFQVLVGGGLGRTPIIGQVIREFLPWPQLLTYLEAILRVYNRYGRRDNIHKARIKILVKELRRRAVPRRRSRPSGRTCKDGPATLTAEEVERVAARFTPPAVRDAADDRDVAADSRDAGVRRLVEAQRASRTRCRATPRSRCR